MKRFVVSVVLALALVVAAGSVTYDTSVAYADGGAE